MGDMLAKRNAINKYKDKGTMLNKGEHLCVI